ncbi:hypothetical protein OAG85_01495 [Verrucomicrobiales bacterium]|nr:hypothetical protein [Verrucomicrobiales bacterium]
MSVSQLGVMRIQALFLSLALMLASSCSSFKRDWRVAVAQPTPNDLSGAWEGQWHSEPTDHRGKLRCLVTPSETQTGHYNFHYWAKWGLLSGAFATVYAVTEFSPERWRFAGDTDLGSLGGIYHHDGEATPARFHADFTSSKGDRGTMTMTRP